MAATSAPEATPTADIPYVPIIIGHHNYSFYELTNGNLNITDPQTQCNVSLCSLLLGNFQYLPSVGSNTLLVFFYAVFTAVHLYVGVRRRTWGFMAGMVGGVILEIVGYAGRIMANHDPFGQPPFLIYIICLTLGPAFMTAAIYICFARIVVVYGETNSRFTPRFYTITFIIFDIVALVLQGAGGGVASLAVRGSEQMRRGLRIMVAGLSWQVVSLTIFMLMSADFAWRTKRNFQGRNLGLVDLTRSVKWKAFLWALVVATLTIYVRCIYRVVELNAGFDSKLANDEVMFMFFEGAMIAIAVCALSIFHPGLAFGSYWAESDFKLGRKASSVSEGSQEPWASDPDLDYSYYHRLKW